LAWDHYIILGALCQVEADMRVFINNLNLLIF
jgi:hypothetical protein